MGEIGRGAIGSRVRVDLREGFNCVGTVRQVYYNSNGRRTVLVEDSLGRERAVHPAMPSVSIEVLDGQGDPA